MSMASLAPNPWPVMPMLADGSPDRGTTSAGGAASADDAYSASAARNPAQQDDCLKLDICVLSTCIGRAGSPGLAVCAAPTIPSLGPGESPREPYWAARRCATTVPLSSFTWLPFRS